MSRAVQAKNDFLYIPEEFVAAVELDPSDLTTRLVMADFLEERGKPEVAAAWRLSAEKRVWPVLMKEELIDWLTTDWYFNRNEVEKWVGKYQWFGADWDKHLHHCSLPFLPEVYNHKSAAALLNSLLNGLVRDPHSKGVFERMEPK